MAVVSVDSSGAGWCKSEWYPLGVSGSLLVEVSACTWSV